MKKFIGILSICCLALTACGNKSETINPEVINTSTIEVEDVVDLASEAYDYMSDTSDLQEVLDTLTNSSWSFIFGEDLVTGIDVISMIKAYKDVDSFAILISNDGVTCYNYCGALNVSEEGLCTVEDLKDVELAWEISPASLSQITTQDSPSFVEYHSTYNVSPIIDKYGEIVGALYTLHQ